MIGLLVAVHSSGALGIGLGMYMVRVDQGRRGRYATGTNQARYSSGGITHTLRFMPAWGRRRLKEPVGRGGLGSSPNLHPRLRPIRQVRPYTASRLSVLKPS